MLFRSYRLGDVQIVSQGGGSLTTMADVVENTSIGVSFSYQESGNTITAYYTTTNTGVDAELTYSVQYFSI